MKEKYDEDLNKLIGENVPNDDESNGDESENEETPKDESNEEETPKEENLPTNEGSETIPSEDAQMDEWKESLIVKRAELYRRMAVLSNNLVALADDPKLDSERKAIVEKQEELEKEMQKIEQLLTGANSNESNSKEKPKFYSLEQLEKMSPEERQKYKVKITNIRSNNRRKLETPGHENAPQWEADNQAITDCIEIINSIK